MHGFFIDSGVALFTTLENIDPGLVNIWGSGGLNGYNIATLLGFTFIGLGFMGSPQVFVRFMSIKNEGEIKKGRWVALIYTLLTDAAAVTIGIIGRYLFTEIGDDPVAILGNQGQNVLTMLVEHVMPVFIVGIYVAVVLAAIMSTIDSLLVVASSAVVRDFYQQILRPDISVGSLTKMSRLVTVGMAILALCLALVVALTTPERTIFWFVIFGWSGIAATFCPTIILSLFWKNFTERGAMAAMVTGFLSIPLFKFILPAIPEIGMYFNQVAELGPSFALSMLAGYSVSRIWPDHELAKSFSLDQNDVKDLSGVNDS